MTISLIKNPIIRLANTKMMDKVCGIFQDKNANMKMVSAIGVGSIVAKDGFGCYLYVKQSLNNKKIPDDKRKFVAALDLANGGLMIAMQLLMFFTISNKVVQSKMFDKFFGKYFSRAATKSYQAILKSKEKLSAMTGKEFHTTFGGYRESLKGAFGHLTALVAATIIGKRIIVPFIATPLADKAKAWMCRNDKPDATHADTTNTYDTKTPAAAKEKTGKTTDNAANNKPSTKENSNLLDQVKKQKA